MSNIIGFPDGAARAGESEEEKRAVASVFLSPYLFQCGGKAFSQSQNSMRAQMDGIRGIGGAEVHAAQLEIVCGNINRIVDGEGSTGFFRYILLPLPHFFPAWKTGRSGHGKNAAVDKGQIGGFQVCSDAFNQVCSGWRRKTESF